MDRYAFLDLQGEERLLIEKISKRAVEENDRIMRVSIEMDLLLAHHIFKLRLEDLLNADKFNFNHDVYGIMNNVNRKAFWFENYFVPRYATQ